MKTSFVLLLLGIGNELCKRLYTSGATVYAVSRSIAPLNELKLECPNINIVCCDLSKWEESRETLKTILKNKTIDGLVNNAAIAIIKPFEELTQQDYDE